MRNRTIDKHFKFSDKEIYILENLSEKTHLSKTDVIASSLKRTILKEAPPKEFYVELEKLNKIGINLNQIAKVANQTGVILNNKLYDSLNDLEKLVIEIKTKYL